MEQIYLDNGSTTFPKPTPTACWRLPAPPACPTPTPATW